MLRGHRVLMHSSSFGHRVVHLGAWILCSKAQKLLCKLSFRVAPAIVLLYFTCEVLWQAVTMHHSSVTVHQSSVTVYHSSKRPWKEKPPPKKKT